MDQYPLRSTTYTVGERGERPCGSWELRPAARATTTTGRSIGWSSAAPPGSRGRSNSLFLQENEGIFLPLGCIHRLENREGVPLTLIEVQTGVLSTAEEYWSAWRSKIGAAGVRPLEVGDRY
jgi:hypothetical protein